MLLGVIILIFGMVCVVLGNRLLRPVPVEVKQKQWKNLSRVEKTKYADRFTEAERAVKVWPDDYR